MTRIEVPNTSLRRRPSRVIWFFWLLLLLVLACIALWTWFSLNFAYSEGDRAGVLQKFDRRGWLCKTQEGELALYMNSTKAVAGYQPQIWDFSVRDGDLATFADLSKAVGHEVQLHYSEHRGVPSPCFGETRFFVDHVTVVDNPVPPAK
jgi:hypothetical protein